MFFTRPSVLSPFVARAKSPFHGTLFAYHFIRGRIERPGERNMKYILSLLTLLCVFISQCRATVFRGILLQNETTGPALAGVRVSADGAQPVISAADGKFDLDFPANHPGTQLNLAVTKNGLLAVHSVLLHPILSADPNVQRTIILMSQPAEREEMARRYFRRKAEQAAENSYEQKQKELDAAHGFNLPVMNDRLGEQLDCADALAAEAAIKLAKDQPENYSDVYLQAMGLFLGGKPNQALDVLNHAEKSPEKTGAQDLARIEKLRGELLALSFQFWDAAAAYGSAAASVPDDIEANFQLGLLYQNLDHPNDAQASFNRCLTLARKSDDQRAVAMTLNKLAELNLLHPTGFDEAGSQFNEALAICRRLATNSPQTYLPIEGSVLENLVHLHDYTHRYAEGPKDHEEALKVYRRLAADNSVEYLPRVTANLNALAHSCCDENQWMEAGRLFEQVLVFRRQLAANAPARYLPDVASTLDNIGYTYCLQLRWDDSCKAYKEALEIFTTLAKDNPNLFGPDEKQQRHYLDEATRHIQISP